MPEVVSPYVVITSGLINIDIGTNVSLHQDWCNITSGLIHFYIYQSASIGMSALAIVRPDAKVHQSWYIINLWYASGLMHEDTSGLMHFCIYHTASIGMSAVAIVRPDAKVHQSWCIILHQSWCIFSIYVKMHQSWCNFASITGHNHCDVILVQSNW